MKRPSGRLGFTLVELLVVITIIAILIALLLPAVQMAREAARKTQCTNNIKQLALGMLGHEERQKFLPSGGWGHWWIGDPDRGFGKEQPGSWFYSTLPFIEQGDLHDLGKDGDQNTWTDTQRTGSARCQQTPLSSINCPTRRPAILYSLDGWYGGGGVAFFATDTLHYIAKGDYAACFGDYSRVPWYYGPSSLSEGATWTATGAWESARWEWPAKFRSTGISYLRSEVTMAWISDGASNTYMVGEKCTNPDDYTTGEAVGDNEGIFTGQVDDNYRISYYPPQQDTPGTDNEFIFGSAHAGSFNMGFCDGSVHSINYSIDAEVHRGLGNREDGKPIGSREF